MGDHDNAAVIARLNDAFRKTFVGGKVVATAGVATLPEETRERVLSAVRAFSEFTQDNDPHGEHDFGALEILGESYFWKIDYFDAALEFGSENPADTSVTTRVLTIMLASEY
jgi:hypothetical protein